MHSPISIDDEVNACEVDWQVAIDGALFSCIYQFQQWNLWTKKKRKKWINACAIESIERECILF